MSIGVFLITHVLPGDVALLVLAGPGGDAPVAEEDLRQLRQELGLDLPLVVQYARWIRDVATLNLGQSLWTGEEIRAILAQRLPVTAQLAALSLVISLAIALPLGIISAMREGSWVDHAARIFAIGGIATPVFWSGTLILVFLVFFFSWGPPVVFVPVWKSTLTSLQQLSLPAIVLGYTFAGGLTRILRSSMLEVLRQDYVRTARSKGLSERGIVVRHALKNAVLPVVTVAGFDLGNLLAGSVIVESIFVLPGIGSELLKAVSTRDWTLTTVIMTLIAGTYMTINLLVDLSYAWLDPRIRYD